MKNTFSPPLIGKRYEVALIGLCIFYSYPNVEETNNTVIETGAGVKKTVRLLRGCYELEEIKKGDSKLMNWTNKTTKGVIGKNKITLRAPFLIKETGWSVEFPRENGLRTLLGFDLKEYAYRKEPYISKKIVHILSVNSILPHCDMISGSMVDVVKSPVSYTPHEGYVEREQEKRL